MRTTKTYSVHKVNLTPFERSFGSVRGIGRARLHTLYLTNILDVVERSIAAVAVVAAGDCQGRQ